MANTPKTIQVTAQHQGLLVALAKQCIGDSERWFGDTGETHKDLGFLVLALAGEVGELANIVKKVERGSLSIRNAKVRHDIVMETTDVFVYLLNIAALLNIDLERTYHMKRAENEERFTEQRVWREKTRVSREH
jgi:NTP pyrophosphatase (non-canonical NTP hydrolase)